MKATRLSVAVVLALCAAWAAQDAAPLAAPKKVAVDAVTIPKLISYQGRVTDTAGRPVPDGQYAMTFKLYTQETGGTEFWSEIQNAETHSGLFAVLLGEVTPIPYIPQDGNCWLEMQVHPDPVMTPRTRLVSSPYAYLAGTATSADSARPKGQAGGDLSGYYPNPTIGDGKVNSDKVQNRSLRGEDFKTPCSLYCNVGNPNAALWIQSTNTGNCIRIDSSANTGIYIRVTKNNGIIVDSAGSNGVNVYDAGSYGVRATGRSGGGRFETDYSAGYGIYVRSYQGTAQNTAIRAYGRGIATGGWSTGFDGGEAPGVVSGDRTIIASGTARLEDGRARVTYPELFRDNIRFDVPVRVTATPVSEPSGLLVVNRGGSGGFGVRLQRIPGMDGSNEVEFDWIAVGTLKDPTATAPDEEE